MSYILEALKRAERERRAGTSSLLDEVQSATGAAAPPKWQRWILPAAIFALAAAILAYLLVEHGMHASHANLAAAAPAIIAPPPLSQPAPAQPVTRVKSEPAPEAAAAIEDDGQISSLKDLDEAPADASAPAAGEAEAGASTSRPFGARGAQTAETASAAADHDHRNLRAASRDNEDTAADTASAEPPASASSAHAEASTQNLREMPDDFRASFPAITVDVHAYSDDPAQRFVLIGGKRYHENDTLPQGPRIFGIVPEGIVFEWQGQRVLYAMNN